MEALIFSKECDLLVFARHCKYICTIVRIYEILFQKDIETRNKRQESLKTSKKRYSLKIRLKVRLTAKILMRNGFSLCSLGKL
jgi:hypothetical protein